MANAFTSDTGNDGNDGLTDVTPMLTLDSSRGILAAGDTYSLERGSRWTGEQIFWSGFSFANCTQTDYGAASLEPTLDFNDGNPGNFGKVVSADSDGLTFENLRILNVGFGGSPPNNNGGAGLEVTGVTGLTLSNVYTENTQQSGIIANNISGVLSISGCEVVRFARSEERGLVWGGGIVVLKGRSLTTATIDNSIVDRGGGEGITAFAGTNNLTVSKLSRVRGYGRYWVDPF